MVIGQVTSLYSWVINQVICLFLCLIFKLLYISKLRSFANLIQVLGLCWHAIVHGAFVFLCFYLCIDQAIRQKDHIWQSLVQECLIKYMMWDVTKLEWLQMNTLCKEQSLKMRNSHAEMPSMHCLDFLQKPSNLTR